MDKKEQTRERVKRYRERQKSVTSVVENVTLSPDSVTEGMDSVTQDVTLPPIMYALVTKKKKLQDICKALEHRNLQSRLYFGCGDFSIPFDIIEDLLEATRKGGER